MQRPPHAHPGGRTDHKHTRAPSTDELLEARASWAGLRAGARRDTAPESRGAGASGSRTRRNIHCNIRRRKCCMHLGPSCRAAPRPRDRTYADRVCAYIVPWPPATANSIPACVAPIPPCMGVLHEAMLARAWLSRGTPHTPMICYHGGKSRYCGLV